MRFLFLSSFLLAACLFAADVQALSVSPLLYEYDLDPGEGVTGSVRLINEEAVAVTHYPLVRDFMPDPNEGGVPIFLSEDVESATSLKKWITFETNTISLQPGEERFVNFTITVPQDVKEGGYYGAILFSNVGEGSESGVTISSQVGSLVFVRVAADSIQNKGDLLSFSVEKNLFSHLPVTFLTRFENQGNAQVIPVGEIRITNMLGKETARVRMNSEGAYTLPHSTRTFKSIWQKNGAQWNNLAFGKYEATLTLSFDGAEESFTAATSFWVFPWHLTLLTIGILFVVCVLIHTIRKRT